MQNSPQNDFIRGCVVDQVINDMERQIATVIISQFGGVRAFLNRFLVFFPMFKFRYILTIYMFIKCCKGQTDFQVCFYRLKNF